MDDLIRGLSPHARVLDLAAGPGSFSYASTPAQVIAMDLAFPSGSQDCFARVVANSGEIPLKDRSVDLAICHSTLEHFENLRGALRELNRVINVDGCLWVAVPDGFSFDDKLYRYLFRGGGHVHRFTLQSLIHTIESCTQLRAQQRKKLHSGFVYLNPPHPEKLPYYPNRAHFLARVPPQVLERLLKWFCHFTRLTDRWLGSNLSHYGWAVIFRLADSGTALQPANLNRLQVTPADLNVCFSCGAGHPASTLLPHLKRLLFWKVYQCGNCGKENIFFSVMLTSGR